MYFTGIICTGVIVREIVQMMYESSHERDIGIIGLAVSHTSLLIRGMVGLIGPADQSPSNLLA